VSGQKGYELMAINRGAFSEADLFRCSWGTYVFREKVVSSNL
jgi:hypothetical protein